MNCKCSCTCMYIYYNTIVLLLIMGDAYLNYSASFFGAIKEPPKDNTGAYLTNHKIGEIYLPISNSYLKELSLFSAPLIPLGQNILTRDEFINKWTIPYRQLKKVDDTNYNINECLSMTKAIATETITYDTTLGTFESMPPRLQKMKMGKKAAIIGNLNKKHITEKEIITMEVDARAKANKVEQIDDAALKAFIDNNYKNNVAEFKKELAKKSYASDTDYFDDITNHLRRIRGSTNLENGEIQIMLDAYTEVFIDDFIKVVDGNVSNIRKDLLRNLIYTDPTDWENYEERNFHIKVHEHLMLDAELSEIYNFLLTLKDESNDEEKDEKDDKDEEEEDGEDAAT